MVESLKSSANSKILDSLTSPYDATMVKRIKDQGGIIIGKTNMDEFGMGSYNIHSSKVVKNPLNHSLVAGGSSGGPAASVAAGHVPVAFGSDTGGSVIYPAHCCQIYGFKPSYGWLSRHGLILYSSSNNCPGLLGRSLEDIIEVFDVV